MSLGPASPARAITLKLASVFLFVVMASLIKAASDEVPPGEAVFFRSAFAIPIIVGWLWARGDLRTGFRTVDPMGHVWRGVVGTMAMGCFFAGLAILPLYEVKAIQYAMPLFVVILAALLLGERIRLVRISAVAFGMAGVLMILWPRLTAFGLDGVDPRLAVGALIVLTGSVCGATAQIFIRKLVRTEETSSIVFWFSLTATVLSLLTLPFGWTVPGGEALACLVGSGLIGGVGQILLTSAYRGHRGALRVRLDAVRGRHRLGGLRRGADGRDAGGRGAGHRRGARHRAARTPARDPAGPRAAGDDALLSGAGDRFRPTRCTFCFRIRPAFAAIPASMTGTRALR